MTKSLVRFIGGLFLIAATIGSGATIGIGALSAGPAGAVTPTFTVNDASDAGLLAPGTETTCTSTNVDVDEANTCTLRSALEASRNLAASTTIALPDPNSVANNAAAQYAVDNTFGQLDVNDNGNTVTIVGAGQSTTIIAAAGESATTRVLKVESGTIADVSGVTIEGGLGNNGGGILDCGTLSLTDSTVTMNSAIQTGGGIELSANGSATLVNDTVSDNAVTTGINNNGDLETGGGIAIENASTSATEDLAVTDSTITENQGTGGDGGGIVAFNTSDTSLDPNLTVTITDSTISDNQINDGAGSTDVFGAGVAVEDGTGSVTGTTITGNGPLGGEPVVVGGGVDVFTSGLTQTFSNDAITDNHAYEGGGVVLDAGITTISNTTIDGNTSTESFAGVFDDTSFSDSTSVSTILSSTISNNNSVLLVGNSSFLGDGGGVTSEGCNALNLTNDTITGNRVANQGSGYLGIVCGLVAGPESPSVRTVHGHQAQSHIDETPSTHFQFDTISSNTQANSVGGANIFTTDDSTVTLADSIVASGVADTSPMNCDFTGSGTFTSLGYNLIDDSTCGTPAGTDIIGKSAQLGSLGNNGGPTQTEVPGSGSPAIGAIPAGVCSGTGVSTDQRGNARGAGANGSCTIGSVEVAQATPPGFNPNGYRMVADEGGIFDFGLNFNGSLANNHLNAPIVGIANSPGPNGYLMVGSDGGVFALGGANFFGSLCCNPLPSPIAAIAATPSEDGYWLAAQNGTITNFGNTPALPAVQVPAGARIVGIASTNDGKGLWLTDNLGDIYAVGDALYLGGMGGIHLNAPVVGIAAAATGQGYLLVASDGGTFNFGVGFFGSVPGSLAPGQHLVAPIVGIAVTHSGNGYWMVGSDGGLFNYGDAPFLGSIYTAIDGTPLNGPIVGIQHLGSAPPG